MMYIIIDTSAWTVTIRGSVNYTGKCVITFLKFNGEDFAGMDKKVTLDSDGNFKTTLDLIQPDLYQLVFQYVDSDKPTVRVEVLLYESDIEVNIKNDKEEIIGSPEDAFMNQYYELKRSNETTPEMKILKERYDKAKEGDDEEEITKLSAEVPYLRNKQNNTNISPLFENTSLVVAAMFLMVFDDFDYDNYKKAYTSIESKLKGRILDYELSQQFVDKIKLAKPVSNGTKAPDITLLTPDGKKLSLSSYKGKYVLLTFWARWCGNPCKDELSNVVKNYNKYKSDKFTVFAVVVDTDERTVAALKTEGMNWDVVVEPRGMYGPEVKQYNFPDIPHNVLIDPNGVILGKGLRGKLLDVKLKEVFKF